MGKLYRTTSYGFFLLQIWDSDLFGPNDYLGSIDLDLTKVPVPFRDYRKCAKIDPKVHKHVNLFKCRRIRGVFPCTRGRDNELTASG